ncbi:MAG: AMP-binding protein [Negativicutes bacterium]|nr:AMP-binding protein [Negativicutes bacterium]
MRQARKSRQQAKRRVAENFWQNQLARQAVVNICADYPRSEGGGQWQIFSPDWPGQFRQLVEDAVRRLGCQPADVVLAALTIVLRRYSAQEDLTVGWHQLPLTVCLDGKQPVDRLVAAVAEQRRQMDGYAADAPSGSGRLVTGVTEVGRCDDSPVEIELVAERDDFAGYWRYRSDLFRPDTIRRWHGHFCRVVGTLAAGQPELAGEVEITTEDERHEVAELFNATALAVDEGATVVSLFLDRVKADPDRIALVSGPQRYSYRQLAGEVERLAGWLADQGLTREQPVAVMVERSAEVVIAALAVMWAGGVYVPVDPTYPPARIQHILTDSQTRIILTQTGLKDRIGGFDGMIADLAGIRQWADGDRPVPVRSRPEGLAYIIYTSGSTGKPKGVMIEHRNLVNYSFWMRDYLQLTADDKTTAYASFGFDASIGELFPILTVGGELHILSLIHI